MQVIELLQGHVSDAPIPNFPRVKYPTGVEGIDRLPKLDEAIDNLYRVLDSTSHPWLYQLCERKYVEARSSRLALLLEQRAADQHRR